MVKLLVILILNLLIIGCGASRPILLNNYDTNEKIDLTNNGILAFELIEDKNLRAEFQLSNQEIKSTLFLDQTINNGSSWKVGIGPWTVKENFTPNENKIRSIYLYQVTPGIYEFSRVNVITVKCLLQCQEVGKMLNLSSDKITIKKNEITYIGSIGLKGEIKFISSDLNFSTWDNFSSVDSTLKTIDKFQLKNMPINKQIMELKIIK